MKTRNTIVKTIIAALVMCCFFSMSLHPVYAASGTKINVITQVSWKYDSGAYTKEFTYNKSGLVTKQAVYSPEGTVSWSVKYTYGSNNLVKTAEYTEYGQKTSKTTYTYNKKNQVTKRVRKSLTGDGSSMITAYTYDKNGNISKQTVSFKNNQYISEKAKFVIRFAYNKKGQMTKKTVDSSPGGESSKGTYTFKYDANGFVKRSDYKLGFGSGYTTRKLTYNSKNILKKYQDTTYEGGGKNPDKVRTVKTKTISVAKALSDIVKGQQAEILNSDYTISIYLGY